MKRYNLIKRLDEVYKEIEDYNKKLPKNKWGSINYKDSISLFNYIDEFIEVNDEFGDGKGVYLIEDFYIGRTLNIKKRLTEHIKELSFINIGKKEIKRRGLNLHKIKNLKAKLKIGKLNIRIIDIDCNNETKLIKQLYFKLPLVNKSCISNEMIENKNNNTIK
jgi:hypothetical protein